MASLSSSSIESSYFGKKVLVTGAAGYIGSSLSAFLHSLGALVIGIVRKKKDFPSHLEKYFIEIRDNSLTTAKDWQSIIEGDIERIFHFAAQTSERKAQISLQQDVENNLFPVLAWIEAARKSKKKIPFLFCSTVTVRGIHSHSPILSSWEEPCTAYDVGKLTAEKYLLWAQKEYGVCPVILRISNVYGKGLVESHCDRGVLNQFCKKASRGEDLTVFGKGNWVRDYIHIQDVVKAFVAAGAQNFGMEQKERIFEICSGKGYSFIELVHQIVEETSKKTGKKVQIRYEEKKLNPIEERNFIGNYMPFSEWTGWAPQEKIEEKLIELVHPWQLE